VSCVIGSGNHAKTAASTSSPRRVQRPWNRYLRLSKISARGPAAPRATSTASALPRDAWRAGLRDHLRARQSAPARKRHKACMRCTRVHRMPAVQRLGCGAAAWRLRQKTCPRCGGRGGSITRNRRLATQQSLTRMTPHSAASSLAPASGAPPPAFPLFIVAAPTLPPSRKVPTVGVAGGPQLTCRSSR